MKADLIDALASPKSDPDFGTKYGLAVLCTVGSCLVLPVILLVGYLAETLKHASAGKKGLPECKNMADLSIQGGICLLAALYLLPAALLSAIGILPLMMGGKGLFSLGMMLNRFISFGALVIALGGLAFTLTGMHTYLHSRQVGDLFNLKSILSKLKQHSNEIGMLLAMTGVVAAGILIAHVILDGFLAWIAGLVSILVATYLNLVLFYGTGVIFGNPAAAAEPIPVVEVESAGTPSSLPTAVPAELPAADPVDATPPPAPSEEDTWKPK